MGTSKSYEGPKDRTPLLPSWAFPEPGSEESTLESPNSPVELPSVPPVEGSMNWRSSKTSLGKAVSSGGGRSVFAKPGRNYVRALGGARKAAKTSRTGRSTTAAIGQFLTNVGNRGINGALESLGLSTFVGKDAETVFAAISNALAPVGSSREEAIARKAVNEALENLYEQYVLDGGDITKLDQMGAQEVGKAIETVVSSYIYNRWLGELEIVLESKAVSIKDAIRLERDMKEYIRECVRLDMQGVNVLTMDWNGSSGQQFIEKIFIEAYSILEEAQ